MNRLALIFAVATMLALTAGTAEAQATHRSDAVSDWNANAGEAAQDACISPTQNPLHESRMYAMTHVAVHDALNAIDRHSRPYALDTKARRGASLDAAVAAAARDVLVPLLGEIPGACPAGAASVEADYAAALARIPNGRAKRRGLEVGQAAAAAVLALRAGDGADTPLVVDAYPEGTKPGEYRFTPGTPFAFAPGWARVTPFVLRDAAQFRPGPPYEVTTRKYAADLEEVKRLGGDGETTRSHRTPEQTEIAHFWVESSPLQWNRIARTVSASAGLDPWQQARLFGLLNMALADGYIGSFETKYHYNYWRPVTAIRSAASDGNPRTSADSTWTPLVTTPPIPDYDSAHSVQGGAASRVLQRFFGTDHVAFATCSLTLPAGSTCDDDPPKLRSYTSFSQAAEENGLSRILVGFHFRKAVDEGIEHGSKIGNHAVDNFLRPAGGHGALAAGSPRGSGMSPGGNGRIAFQSDREGGDSDIWTMTPNGSNLVNLTIDSAANDELPSWRADGRRIVFISDRVTPRNPALPGSDRADYEIFVMNADGSNQTQITFNRLDDEHPSWSPNGERIVFQRDFDPVQGEIDYDILSMKADGTSQRNLTNSRGVIDHQPDWSPTGGKIAFARAPDAGANNDIYTMRPDGSNVRQLTTDALDNEFPDWSPDGNRIAFNSNRDDPDEANFEVYTMRAGGGDVRRLTFNPAGDGLPAWSPTGRRIAFGSDRDGSPDVFTMRADGQNQMNRTSNDAFDYAPDWGAARPTR
jgi:Tol biopolymer transport system component